VPLRDGSNPQAGLRASDSRELRALTCGGAAWSLTVSSTYAPSNDLRNRAQETTSLTHDVSASLQLLPSITIMPAVSVTEDAYEWSGIRSQTTSASVSVSWISILEGVDLTVWGSYARNKTADNLYDGTAINNCGRSRLATPSGRVDPREPRARGRLEPLSRRRDGAGLDRRGLRNAHPAYRHVLETRGRPGLPLGGSALPSRALVRARDQAT
jgi:hypothetical protein